MNKEYVYPPKELLDKDNIDLETKYYHLSKNLLKKDLNDKLIIPIGIDENKKRYYVDLKNGSGLFIGGETGSGKSMLLDSIIITLLFKNSPEDLKFVLMNPSRVELNYYNDLPHMFCHVIYSPTAAIDNLKVIIKEINARLDIFHTVGSKTLDIYNNRGEAHLPHILIIIDESNDIMEQEESKKLIKQILDRGHYAGIHLILATSSYFAKDFDQSIISRFSYVSSFDLASKEQAQFINLKGADLLMVAGEAMIKTNGSVEKIQTPYVTEDEINRVIDFIIRNNKEVI